MVTSQQVADQFPGWMTFQSNAGRWWASLRRELTRYEMAECCDRMVDADDLDGLADKLREQERRQALAARNRRTKPGVRSAS
ncbi:hypothetical protein [Bailinhaonella thermotolerans]|uniref:Uncharacterized protein n=1 Tax=Bailinhaonella thermotolerans TaxID=1070861 RepID=A0A3A4B142_9ACTN|nr:hypothetical protein [Bailinhaonella thermotolerans]RJL31747.1 hypothetical protein D5H75_18805 [Bailinhaonella thermotolerans]